MEPTSIKLRQRSRDKSWLQNNSFIHKLKCIEHIEVYDNEKFLILVGMDRDKLVNHIIKFNRCSLELECEVVEELMSTEQVSAYICRELSCK